jgi:hypothetical protein
MTIRTYQPGDEAAQVSIYNEAGAALPRFKPTTLDEVRRRCRGPDFDPCTRLFALAGGRPVGYLTFHPNGRVSYPWCRKGHEALAEPLFEAALEAMRQRGWRRVFAAYRGDWPAQRDFFLGHGFRTAREMVNFVLDIVEMPTPAARPASAISRLTPADLPAVLELGRGVLRVHDVAGLERHLLGNPSFPAESAFVLRSRTDGTPLAVGVLVADPAYANPRQLDAGMPCFRLGAFGTEGMQVKRVNGLISFLVAEGRDVKPLALDLMGHAVARLESTDVETFAAQVPSDAERLVRLYKQYFRHQGSFPVYERDI